MRPLTVGQQETLQEEVLVVRSIVSSLRLLRVEDEDRKVALARLEDWLDANDGRWVG